MMGDKRNTLAYIMHDDIPELSHTFHELVTINELQYLSSRQLVQQ